MTRYNALKQQATKRHGADFSTRNLNPNFLYAFNTRTVVIVGFTDSQGKIRYLSTGYIEVTEDAVPHWLLVKDRVSGGLGQPVTLTEVLVPLAVARELSKTKSNSQPNLRRAA
jgi:hypothetical protein